MCYDEFWLSKDMENMGYIFEYCTKYYQDLYGVPINRDKFLNAFMQSICRKVMEEGHPGLLSQSAKDTIQDYIESDCDNNYMLFKGTDIEQTVQNQYYWVGWIYAYIHYKSKKSSKFIVNKLPLDTMLDKYYLGHEEDKETFYNSVKDVLFD